jgi:hypothetical protein
MNFLHTLYMGKCSFPATFAFPSTTDSLSSDTQSNALKQGVSIEIHSLPFLFAAPCYETDTF